MVKLAKQSTLKNIWRWGSPFDAQTEDEQEEDVLETSVSHALHFSNLPVPFIYF